ncbi:MAG: AMP-binding protein [Bacteroidales bacterium]|jgi:acyl-CoA synthetase (AMP-forming)/AMP-acid ligase II
MNEIIWQRWERNSANNPNADAVIHWIPGKEPFRWSFSDLLKTAKLFSVMLKKSGIKRNDVCALIIQHNPYFYPLYMGVSALGAIPAVLAYPNPRLHPEKFSQGIEGMSQRSGLDWIITESSLVPILKPLIERKGSTIKGIHLPLEQSLNAIDIKEYNPPKTIMDSDPFLLQHSSGTTGLQKPVILSQRAILDHAASYGEALKVNAEDKVVSWLPLYHDMGLIASFLLPLIWGIPSIQINPFDWIIAPELMLMAISKEKASLAWMPNFAFNLMANKIHDEDIEGISLSSMRMLINSSEPIRKNSNTLFADKFRKFGFNPNAISTLYGMAETTMAVTQTVAGEKPGEVKADRMELSHGRLVHTDEEKSARVCVSSGKLIRGCEIKIVDDNRQELSQGRVGEIAIRSVSLFDGYRNYPEKTAAVMQEGWYFSGDFGFEFRGEYYIIGRKKDIIISAGKNIFPEDVEDLLAFIKGLIPGRIVAFGEDDEEAGTELVSVIAETGITDEKEMDKLKIEILKAGMSADIAISNVYLVPQRWLIKSSAGKPGRNINKERILEMKLKESRGKYDI